MVLYTISLKPCHGYRIAQIIGSETQGAMSVKAGALYPALKNLEKKEWVVSKGRQENGRQLRYYTITPAGREALQSHLGEWHSYVANVNAVLGRGAA